MNSSRRSLLATQSTSDVATEATLRRSLVVVCLMWMALIHLLDLEGKIQNAPLVGVLYIPLIVVALLLAEVLIRSDDNLAWAAAGALAAATLIGFALSRTVGLPSEGGHEIGKWTGDLGLSSMLIEGVIVWLAVARWMRRKSA